MKLNGSSLVLVAILFAVSISLLFAATATHAQNATATETEILSKLDAVLNNQKAILQGIDSLKNELNLVKIRITQQQ